MRRHNERKCPVEKKFDALLQNGCQIQNFCRNVMKFCSLTPNWLYFIILKGRDDWLNISKILRNFVGVPFFWTPCMLDNRCSRSLQVITESNPASTAIDQQYGSSYSFCRGRSSCSAPSETTTEEKARTRRLERSGCKPF